MRARCSYPAWALVAFQFDLGDVEALLAAPTLLSVLERTVTAQPLDPTVQPAVFAALRSAAEHRVEGVLGEKRRRTYDHAARLTIAAGVAYALMGNAPEGQGFVQQIAGSLPTARGLPE